MSYHGFYYIVYFFAVILVGRVLCGVAVGLNAVAYMPLITSWFSSKEKPIMFSLISVVCTACSLIVYSTAVGIMRHFSSWHAPFVLPLIFNGLCMVLWIIFGKEAPANTSVAPVKAVRNNAFLIALKRKDLWVLTIYMWVVALSQSILVSYLPAYLETMRGFDAQTASYYTSFYTVTSMIGGLLAGAVSSLLGRRKPVIIASNVLTMIFMVLVLRDIGTAGLILSIIGYGLVAAAYSPIVQTITTEIDGVTPQLASAAYSMTIGIGSIMTFFPPMILSLLLEYMDLSRALHCFAAVIPVAVIVAFFIKETGPKRKKHDKAGTGR
ncbi:MAG: MFS transporter [Christensenellaceae bacterium]|nr:MFS transporter [Christensenellaceae bacterium]